MKYLSGGNVSKTQLGKKHFLPVLFHFKTCFVPGQTAEGNISTMSASENRQLFKLKSGLINASDYSSGKGQCATKTQTCTHTLTQELFEGIDQYGGGGQISNGKKKWERGSFL